MDNNELLDNLKLIVGDTQVRTGEPMNIHTTFRIGGCADYYVQPSSIEELQSLIRFLNKSDIEISMLYNRAAEVSEKRKSYIKAVAYYTKAKNWDRIAALYAGKNGRRLIERAPGIFQSVRENIEEVMWEKYPTVMLNYLYYMSTKENVHNVMPLYEEIINDINNHNRNSNYSYNRIEF